MGLLWPFWLKNREVDEIITFHEEVATRLKGIMKTQCCIWPIFKPIKKYVCSTNFSNIWIFAPKKITPVDLFYCTVLARKFKYLYFDNKHSLARIVVLCHYDAFFGLMIQCEARCARSIRKECQFFLRFQWSRKRWNTNVHTKVSSKAIKLAELQLDSLQKSNELKTLKHKILL